ncbi:MAG: hypothetical protein WBM17_16725 [Anaerolineales bacterium]
MNIPKFWAKSEQTVTGPQKAYFLRNWQGSDVSVEDARQKAAARAKEIAQKVALGGPLDRYGYCDRALREEIKEAVQNRFKDEVGIITRNAYGALILNATGAMFIDIDIPGIDKPKKAGFFGSKKESFSLDPYMPAIHGVEAWAGRHPEYGIRIYATFAGLRCLVMNTVFKPKSDHAAEIMRDMNSDPLYLRLCIAQECFRARLTPKPWRCGLRQPGGALRYPRENPLLEEEFRRWEKQYDAAVSKFAVCSFVKQVGSRNVHPDVESVMQYHDRVTRSESNLPLA